MISVKDNFMEEFLVFIGVEFLIYLYFFFSPIYDIVSSVVTFYRTFAFIGWVGEFGLDLKGFEWKFGVKFKELRIILEVDASVLLFVDIGFDDGGFRSGSWGRTARRFLLAKFHWLASEMMIGKVYLNFV